MSENRLNNKIINPEEFELIVDEQLYDLKEKIKNDKWVVYPDVDLSIDDIKKHYNMEENKNLITDGDNASETVNPVVPELLDEEAINEEMEETVELTEEEKAELEQQEYIQFLKDSKKVFKPVKHKGNVTTNQFGAAYKEKRRKKNKATKKSRRANRK